MTPSTRSFMDDFWAGGFLPLPFRGASAVHWFWESLTSLFSDLTLLRYRWPVVFVVVALVGVIALWRQSRLLALFCCLSSCLQSSPRSHSNIHCAEGSHSGYFRPRYSQLLQELNGYAPGPISFIPLLERFFSLRFSCRPSWLWPKLRRPTKSSITRICWAICRRTGTPVTSSMSFRFPPSESDFTARASDCRAAIG